MESINCKNIGKILREYRDKQHITAAQVCASVGVHPSLLTRIETAAGIPNFRTVELICNAIGVEMYLKLKTPETGGKV